MALMVAGRITAVGKPDQALLSDVIEAAYFPPVRCQTLVHGCAVGIAKVASCR
jgi:ABC-type hemin transport system ATPase subunit